VNQPRRAVRSRVEEELQDLLEEPILDMHLVTALAADAPLTADQRHAIQEARRSRGDLFYSDLLFTISHEYYEPGEARRLWDRILDHKERLARLLGRDAGVAVAALDYLTNVRGEVEPASIIRSGKMAKVAEVALRDGLTGLLVHSTFLRRLDDELRRAARYQQTLGVLLLDLDDFKEVNDRLGHQAGDDALERVGSILGGMARETDVAGRYGGEEFGMVLTHTAPAEAGEVAERLRRRVQETFAATHGLTASIGVSTFPTHGRECSRLIEAADEALYHSKSQGKNRSTMYPERPLGPASGKSSP
jgi:diguanylate cyclase (GGDEF)-like protein